MNIVEAEKFFKEYDGNYSMWQAYKFKYENDEVISVNIEVDNLNEILLISKKGMAIRFQGESVNTMGSCIWCYWNKLKR